MWCLLFGRGETLTEEDDDAEENGYDCTSAQTGTGVTVLVSTVSIDVTLAHFNPQIGGIGHGQVARVCDYDGDLVDATFNEANFEAHLSIVTWEEKKTKRVCEWCLMTPLKKRQIWSNLMWLNIKQQFLLQSQSDEQSFL